jgi:hypothetical protein
MGLDILEIIALAKQRDRSAADVVDAARALAVAGRHREAIDLLSNQPAESLDAGALHDLVLWRNAAFASETAQGPPVWPRRFADPFPGADAPPETQVETLTAEILGGAILHHGSLIVRGLITPEQTRHLAEVVRTAFAASAEFQRAEADASEWYTRYPLTPESGIKPQARTWVEEGGGVLTADSPRRHAGDRGIPG